MIRSMTGYGAAASGSEALQASVTIRSLNNRFFELSVHLPRRLLALEPAIRQAVQARVQRGRCDVTVQATPRGAENAVVVSEGPAVAPLIALLRRIQAEHGLAGEVAIGEVARFPGAIEVSEPPFAAAAHREPLLELLGRALDELEAMRRAEGQGLAGELERLLAAVEAAVARIGRLSDAGKSERTASVLQKVKEAGAQLGLDEGRIYQEVVRIVERHDVSEELQRLLGHVGQARELLGGSAPSGKRLDFLAQEMSREANTIGSKAVSAQVVGEVVALKSEIERLREQVQNVE
jgi:uncharacterized protein (TIGR00255 family)